MVLTGPVYKSLKARWPDATVHALVKPQFADALRGHPGLDAVVPFEGVAAAARLIREGGYTHVLDLHANLRSRLIMALAPGPSVARYRKDALARRLFVSWRLGSPSLQRHTVERYLEALSAWGVPPAPGLLSSADWAARGALSTAKSVLVLQSAFLGDAVLTLPLLRRLKESLPGARVTVLTRPGAADVFRGSPWADEVLLDDKKGRHGGLLGPWRMASELARHGFELAVIPHRSFRSALVARLAGIPRRVGFDSSAGRLFLTDAVPFSWLMHDLERNLALALPLGGEAAPAAGEDRYLAPSETPERLRALLAPLAGRRLAGVHPGSAWPTKRWHAARFAELCRRLQAEGWACVLVGGPEDAKLGAEIAAASGALDLVGKTSLSELKALVGSLKLFVTNDSGPMHLAAAAGVPVVAIFGATTRELGFFPYGSGHRVVEAELACRPCGLHGAKACPEGHFLCMGLVTVDQVHEACREAAKTPVSA